MKSYKTRSHTDSLSLFFRDSIKNEPLSEEEQRKLFALYKEGSYEAREQLIKTNLALVVSIAYKHLVENGSFSDLIQSGAEGLIKAVDKFDLDRNINFSTYATFWIKKEILEFSYHHNRFIRLPHNKQGKYNLILKEKRRIFMETGRDASFEDVARKLKIEDKDIKTLLNYKEKLASIENNLFENASEIVIEDDPVEHTIDIELTDMIDDIILNFDYKEQEIIKGRLLYDFYNIKKKTYDELGEEFGISREWARQLSNKVILLFKKEVLTREKLKNYVSVKG